MLSSPESSRILKIATELSSSALSAQLGSGDTEGAQEVASYLKQLLNHVPDDDDDAERWEKTLDLLPPSRRKTSVVMKRSSVSYDDDESERLRQSLNFLPPRRRKSAIIMKRYSVSQRDYHSEELRSPGGSKSSLFMKKSNVQDDDKHVERRGQSFDLLPFGRRKSSVHMTIPE